MGQPRHQKMGKAFVLGLVGLAVITAGGFAAYKLFFDRPGEAAVAMIPADADMVVTLDTKPSERQATTFKAIYDGLEREGLTEEFDKNMSDWMDKSPLVAELRPMVSTSFAMAMWAKPKGEPEMVMLMALKDQQGVDAVLRRRATPEQGAFRITQGGTPAYLKVIGPYLALSQEPRRLEQIQSTHDGKTPAIPSLSGYQSARAGLPSDANFMFFMTGKAYIRMMESADREAAEVAKRSLSGLEWVSFSATVEPNGLALDYQSPFSPQGLPGGAELAGIAPLDTASLGRLPAGSYGLVAMAQISRWWPSLEQAYTDMGRWAGNSSAASVREGIAQLEKETGIRLKEDILTGLQGDIALAVYPGPTNKPEDVDLLLTLSDAHGGRPADLARKLRAWAEQASREQGEPLQVVEEVTGATSIWSLDARSRQAMTDAVTSGQTSSPMASKNLFVALRGQMVWLSSSRAILNRATTGSEGLLQSEAAFASVVSKGGDAPQNLLVVDLHRILTALAPAMEEGMQNSGVEADDVIHLFGDGSTALSATSSYDGKVARARMVIPLDWERLVRVGGAIAKENRRDKPTPTDDAAPSFR